MEMTAAGIRRFATQHGQALAARPDIAAFSDFLDVFPWLLDTGLPYHHWRRETMGSVEARAGWVGRMCWRCRREECAKLAGERA